MERGNDWSARVAAAVGTRLARYRADAGMTAAALGARCDELGMRLDRNVITKLETGRRQSVTVDEIYVLAAALQIPPAVLLFGVGTEEATEILPGYDVPPWHALRWFSGVSTFPRPDGEDVLTDWVPVTGPAAPITAYRFSEVAGKGAMAARDHMMTYQEHADAATGDAERRAYQAAAERELQAERRELDAGKQIREWAAGEGYLPPAPIGMYQVLTGARTGAPDHR